MLVEQKKKHIERDIARPEWVVTDRLSERLWKALTVLEKEKTVFIGGIKERNIAVGKRATNISKRQIADRAGCSPSSLHNRVFSVGFQISLDEANNRLNEKLRAKLFRLGSVGIKDRRKAEILEELRTTAGELNRLQQQQVSEIVESVFERLPLRARRNLMLD